MEKWNAAFFQNGSAEENEQFMLHAPYVKTNIVVKELLWVSSVCWDK